jgi:DNA-binding NarL/FixJ family response regulator
MRRQIASPRDSFLASLAWAAANRTRPPELLHLIRHHVGCEHIALDLDLDGSRRRVALVDRDPRTPVHLPLRLGPHALGRLEADAHELDEDRHRELERTLPLVALAVKLVSPRAPLSMPAMVPDAALEEAARRLRLTPRETEVLGQLALGRSNVEIAHAIGCLEGTTHHHVRRLLEKSALGSRTQLVALFWARFVAAID